MPSAQMPRHVQRSIDTFLTRLMNKDPNVTYESDTYARVFFSETDKRTAGYALFLHTRDAA
jgi:hypothetical protein